MDDFVIVLAIVCVSIGISILGFSMGVKDTRKQAIKAGVGEYIVNEHGSVSFQFFDATDESE